MNKKRREN